MTRRKNSKTDRTRVNRYEPYELEYWSKKFNISAQQLRNVIEQAGTDEIKAIEKYLIRNQ